MRLPFFLMSLLLLAAPWHYSLRAQPTTSGFISRTEARQDPKNLVSAPAYPTASRAANEEGAVILGFRIRPDGSVNPKTIKVNESSGWPSLDQAAINEAVGWRFIPATENGQSIESDYQLRVIFALGYGGGNSTVGFPAEEVPDSVINGSDTRDPAIPLNVETGGMGRF